MRRVNTERDCVRVLLWNIYDDQYNCISKESLDGKSISEVIRRIIDFGIDKQLDQAFSLRRKRADRSLHKVQFGVTQKQYDWFTKNFPSRKKAEGLRFVIDQYFKGDL